MTAGGTARPTHITGHPIARLAPAGEPLEGVVPVGDGPLRNFHSRLELIAALDAVSTGDGTPNTDF